MRIEQAVQINLSTAGQSAATQNFASLQAGDVVSVQILGTDGGKLMIRMQDGSTLRADFKGEMFFLPGDSLELTLESKSSRAVSFRLSSVNGQPLRMEVSDQESNLIRSGIEPTRQNVFASRILQQNGYTPTQQNLENLSRIIQENPQLPQEVSAFFAANNIEPEEDVAQMLAQIQAEPSLLGNRADALATLLRQAFPSAADASLEALPVDAAVSLNTAVSPQPTGVSNSREFLSSFLQNLQKTQPQAAQLIAGSQRFPALAEQIKNLPLGEAHTAAANFLASLSLNPRQEQAALAALQTAYVRSSQLQPEQPAQPLPANADVTKTDLPPSSKAAASAAAPVIQNGQTLQALFQKLNEFFVNIVPSDNTSTAQSLQNAVQKQEKLAEDIQSATINISGEKHVVSQQAAEMRSQIGLNSGLENFYYYQIPVQFREQKTTAELYVFERNKRIKNTRDDCTILIALDTQNMGRCETMLRADGSGLDIRLRLGSQSACRFAETSAPQLRQSLADAGFHIKNLSFDILEAKTTPLNAQSVFQDMSNFAPGGLDIQV